MTAMVSPQQFCVKWNSYSTNLQTVFPRLLTSEHFVDITLACEGQMIKCHKVVLSACSTYFEQLLVSNPCQHPIIFMKDMKHWEIQALVDFMYKGEVNVSQDELNSLLVAAEALQIRGLCSSEGLNGLTEQQSASTEVPRLPKGTVVSGRGESRKPTPPPCPPPAKRRREEASEKVVTTTEGGSKRRSSRSESSVTAAAKEDEQLVEEADDLDLTELQKKLIKEEDLDDDADQGFNMDGDGQDDYEQQDDSDGTNQDDALARAGPSGVAQGRYNLAGTGDKAGTAADIRRTFFLEDTFEDYIYTYETEPQNTQLVTNGRLLVEDTTFPYRDMTGANESDHDRLRRTEYRVKRPESAVYEAVMKVLNGASLRAVSGATGIPKSTIHSYMIKNKIKRGAWNAISPKSWFSS